MTTPIQDQDGSGDWSPAGLSIPYSPRRWAEFKKCLPRKVWHLASIRVIDSAEDHSPRYKGYDPIVHTVAMVGRTLIIVALLGIVTLVIVLA